MNHLGLTTASRALFYGPFLIYVLLPLLDLRFGPTARTLR